MPLNATVPDGPSLDALQLALRAAICFIVALVLVRVAGRRAFGMRSPFDNVIALLLGAVLSRALVGASPFFPTIGACGVLVLLHRGFAWLAMRHDRFGRLIKGESITVFDHGAIQPAQMARALMSDEDLRESIRSALFQDSFANIREIHVERNGSIGVIRNPG